MSPHATAIDAMDVATPTTTTITATAITSATVAGQKNDKGAAGDRGSRQKRSLNDCHGLNDHNPRSQPDSRQRPASVPASFGASPAPAKFDPAVVPQQSAGHKRPRTAYSIPAPVQAQSSLRASSFVTLDHFATGGGSWGGAGAGARACASWRNAPHGTMRDGLSALRVSREGHGRFLAASARHHLSHFGGDASPDSPIDSRVPSIPAPPAANNNAFASIAAPTLLSPTAAMPMMGPSSNDDKNRRGRRGGRRVTFAAGDALAVVVGQADADVDRTSGERSQPARTLSAEELLRIRMHTYNTVMAYRAMAAGATQRAASEAVALSCAAQQRQLQQREQRQRETLARRLLAQSARAAGDMAAEQQRRVTLATGYVAAPINTLSTNASATASIFAASAAAPSR